MQLRKLELKDVPGMLEWMHDKSVVEHLQTNFSEKTALDCEHFIQASWENKTELHMAVVDDNDEYMGTVSLKHITKNAAEFAITVRARAMGKGFAQYAMKEILRIGFEELGLTQIYWCISPKNRRAIRFYDKNLYHKVDIHNLRIDCKGYDASQIESYLWYLETRPMTTAGDN